MLSHTNMEIDQPADPLAPQLQVREQLCFLKPGQSSTALISRTMASSSTRLETISAIEIQALTSDGKRLLLIDLAAEIPEFIREARLVS